MNKKFMKPVILGLGDLDDDEIEFPGTAQSGLAPYACTFADWLIMWSQDYNDDGVDENDFVHWWYVNGFGADVFEALNGKPLPDDPFPNP